MSKCTRVVELLAPAGDMVCLHAAVSAGADAVYLGLDQFNARRNAGNFTLENFAEACDYAHLRAARVYVTLNVEILPSEIEQALNLAREAYRLGADAFIVQDVGLASELKRAIPEAPLHISTQMNIHNAAGVAAVAQLGARRITLARELAVSEISELAALASDFGMEVECFAHGALCICYSGQCLMSSMIGGRSANRGMCAQACRLPYELHRAGKDAALPAEGDHLLSPKDLCTIDLLDDLSQAGVASLKIEGRMKSPDYVHEVVSVYREVLDGAGLSTDAQRMRLAEAFSRGFTTAYLEDERGNDMMSYGRPNNRGVFAGRVSRVADGRAFVSPEIELHDGDVLEFWTNGGRFAETLATAHRESGGLVPVPVEKRVGKGDRVFRVRNAETAFEDDSFSPRVPVAGTVSLKLGKPARIRFELLECPDGAGRRHEASGESHSGQAGLSNVRSCISSRMAQRFPEGCSGEAAGAVVERARTKAVSEDDVYSHVDRFGQTPFFLAGLDIDLDDNVGIGFSQLHRLRSDALSMLEEQVLSPYRDRLNREDLRGRITVKDVADHVGRTEQKPPSCLVAAWVANPGCARVARRAGADALYVPLLNFKRGQSQIEGVRQEDAEQAGYPKQCIMALPTIDHDPVEAVGALSSGALQVSTREWSSSFDHWDYVREGKPVFADSLASAVRALEMGAIVEVGPHVPVTNRASLRLMSEWGVSRVWLSPELTLGQIADLAASSTVPLGLAVSGAQELMITEHCLLMSQGPCTLQCQECPRRSVAHKLVDRKGFEFPVVTDMLGRSHLYNGIELDVIPSIVDLIDIGVSAVMVDATLMNKKATSDAVGRALRARDLAMSEHRGLGKRPGTTTGHLHRGVS